MFEVLTLAQTQKLAKKITVVIYGSEYWKKVFNLDVLVDTGAISPKDIELFNFADTPEQAFDMLRKGLTENHLAGENAAGKPAGSKEHAATIDPTASSTFEDFLGPELAKTNK
jgi:predicted Rossmann-fold nucleotide-binding protein